MVNNCRAAKRRGKYPPLTTDTEEDNYCCGASVASEAAVHNLKYIKDRYENLRFCMGFSLAFSGP